MARANYKAVLLVWMLCMACRLLSADPAPLLFSSFFAEKNLSSTNISCFFQDSRGYMWIGTGDGLNYFNGKTVRVFKHDYQNNSSLPDNSIISVAEDQEKNIWIGTARGIARLNLARFTFENYQEDLEQRSLGFKIRVYVDKQNTVWAVSGGQMYRFNAVRHGFERMVFGSASGLRNGKAPFLFTGIFQDSKKRYWVSSSDDVYRFFPNEGHFRSYATDKISVHFFPVQEDLNGNLFCGTWENGLYQLDEKQHALKTIVTTGHYNCYVAQCFNDKQTLWLGNNLSAYDAEKQSITQLVHRTGDPYSSRDNSVSALYIDAQNQLWIGYYSKGIQIMSPSNQIFRSYTISQKPQDFTSVQCFVRTKNYNYVGGWHNYSLARLDKQNRVLKTWRSLLPGIECGNNISDGWCDQRGNIWFTGSPGLICFNEATEKTQLFKLDTAVSKKSFFLRMVPEGDSVLWIAGYFSGLSRFSLNTKTFKNWGGNKRALFWSIIKDDRGLLWLANNSGVLTSFDPGTETFNDRHYHELTEWSIYRDILFDSIGHRFWIATDNGLLQIDRNTFAARLFTEKDNLPTNQVNALQLDSRNRLWMGTNKGLCFYDPKQNVCRTFFSNHGLPENALTQLFSMQPGDELVIGCNDGFSLLQTSAIPPESFLTSVNIDKVYESGRIIPTAMANGLKTVELAHNENNIQVEFSSNDLIDSEDHQLLFRLEGVDDQWRTAQNGVINYSKLAPGSYQLHVSGVGHTGVKPLYDDVLCIIIHPPFWKTIPFMMLVGIFLLGLTVLVVRYIVTRNLREKILILEKEQAVEKERSRISQDMHDELGSGLTKISIMSEVAMMQLADVQKAKGQLENISASSRGLVDNLQDIIWILNPKNDSLENLCAYIQEYALKYFEPFNIQVQMSFPEKIPAIKLSEDQRRNILLVFKESFNNISRHSGCKNVTVTMQHQQDSIRFVITDDGKGFDKAAIRHFANGLENMKRRMESINGTFAIHSEPGRGATSELTFKM